MVVVDTFNKLSAGPLCRRVVQQGSAEPVDYRYSVLFSSSTVENVISTGVSERQRVNVVERSQHYHLTKHPKRFLRSAHSDRILNSV
jgi:hypothetical protein